MTIEQLSEKIMVSAIASGAGASTAGRSQGLTALAMDARQAAKVLLGLKTVEGWEEFLPDGAPRIGRPRKMKVGDIDARPPIVTAPEDAGLYQKKAL